MKCRMSGCQDEAERLGLCQGHYLWLSGLSHGHAESMVETIEVSITCPRCRRVSHHPEDIANRYCSQCGFHDQLDELWSRVKRGELTLNQAREMSRPISVRTDMFVRGLLTGMMLAFLLVALVLQVL